MHWTDLQSIALQLTRNGGRERASRQTNGGDREDKMLNKPSLHSPHGIAINQEQGLPQSVS